MPRQPSGSCREETPLLPRDEGHILVSLVEGMRRRAVPQGVYQRSSASGMALIVLVTVLAFGNELSAGPR
jgi:membrane-associated protease RseP (regulator of RpoE activity)